MKRNNHLQIKKKTSVLLGKFGYCTLCTDLYCCNVFSLIFDIESTGTDFSMKDFYNSSFSVIKVMLGTGEALILKLLNTNHDNQHHSAQLYWCQLTSVLKTQWKTQNKGKKNHWAKVLHNIPAFFHKYTTNSICFSSWWLCYSCPPGCFERCLTTAIKHCMDSCIGDPLKLMYVGNILFTVIYSQVTQRTNLNFFWFLHELGPGEPTDKRNCYYYSHDIFSNTVFIHQWLLFCEKSTQLPQRCSVQWIIA